jgi:thiamine pyrophosphate-dependent acetolactate synthase large subunit-like protein
VVADALGQLNLDFIALNPGSSFRGLHDSLVNYLGNEKPQMILCLHEEHAVAIAHAYAKVTGRPMAVALHSNVGLMHATMAIFDAYCDRAPVILLGATGPLDATARRPWIDWLHSCADQAAMIRPYIKWDDQPGSVAAAATSVLRAHQLATSEPCAPVYVSLDVALQEEPLAGDSRSFAAEALSGPASRAYPDPEVVQATVRLLTDAVHPVILVGRCSRGKAEWDARIDLAQRTGATVFTHLELPAAFPTAHPQFGGVVPAVEPSPELLEALDAADVVLSLDWLDLGGTLQRAWGGELRAPLVSVSVDHHLHNGWSKDHFAPAPATMRVGCNTDAMVERLLAELPEPSEAAAPVVAEAQPTALEDIPLAGDGQLRVRHIATALREALDGSPATLVRVSGAWTGDMWPIEGPLDALGGDGGGGLGSGPGMAVGAALALRDTGRLPVAVIGDGDFAMGATAIWTAVHYSLPLVLVLANNRSFLNDEMHQHRMAEMRGRPIANRWIGQRMHGPDIDHATLARGQGALGLGPITTKADLRDALVEAIAAARTGTPAVVDVWTTAEPASPSEGPWLSRPAPTE